MLATFAKKYTQLRGWHTNRKLIIIESDDWGLVRMPDKQVYETLSKRSNKIKNDPYSKLDTLANVDDLEALFSILSSHKDFKGNSPIITANTIVANPDYNKIKESGFNSYHYTPFYDSIVQQAKGQEIIALWKKGIEEGLFKPQLHGREHLHVPLWLAELQNGNKDLLTAFEMECFGVPYKPTIPNKRKNLMAALDENQVEDEASFQEQAIKEAAAIFSGFFGYSSETFIAPAYVWNKTFEQVLSDIQIEGIQGLAVQYEPQKAKFKKRLHYTGQKNKYGQVYLIRNAFFEPSLNPTIDWVAKCLSQINEAFKFNKPAIIGSHRLNFIGGLVPENRNNNLKLFNQLLQNIINKWPEVEFITTSELCNKIKGVC